MSDAAELRTEVARKERELAALDDELHRLRTGARFNGPHLVLAISLLLVVVAFAARGWVARREAQPKPACAAPR
jgi:hypothetical protein